MAAVPERKHHTVAAIYAHYERTRGGEKPRAYLGASIIGGPCERALWYAFRWAAREDFDGRMFRLFETGHREEARLLDDLEAAGVEVSRGPAPGQQWAVSALGGHLRGHMDSAINRLPEAPRTWHVFEAKTCNTKSFAEVKAKGVKVAKPRHYGQMQIYMGLTGMDRAAYFAVCKDTDEIHMERVEFDQAAFDRLMARADRVIFSDTPPPRISENAAWFECKFCPAHALCHGTAVPAPTCRTCLHVTPERDGTWSCARHKQSLNVDEQRTGCQSHRVIPILLERFAQPVEASVEDNWIRYQMADGGQFLNGARPDGYDSGEIAACEDKRALADPKVLELAGATGGRVAR